jgi:hypothetical protein
MDRGILIVSLGNNSLIISTLGLWQKRRDVVPRAVCMVVDSPLQVLTFFSRKTFARFLKKAPAGTDFTKLPNGTVERHTGRS